eukprot:GHVU01219644.1.p2 GENE.GHVU01219644.1~~GHVU01219644.1.p2  ORF type:complete len:172 (-),score=19.33 GHVU01219644.1:573-1088(-)
MRPRLSTRSIHMHEHTRMFALPYLEPVAAAYATTHCCLCRLQLTRGDVVMIVVSAIKSLDRQVRDYYSPRYRWVEKAHNRCGIFPLTPTQSNDAPALQRHLESLRENDVYARLAECDARLNLEEAASDGGGSESEFDIADAGPVLALDALDEYYSTEEADTRALLEIVGGQ